MMPRADICAARATVSRSGPRDRSSCEQRRVRAFPELQRLHTHGCPVTQYFCHAFRHLVGVIADADHGVRAGIMRLDQHGVESLLACSFSELGEERDIATTQRLQAGADCPENRSGAHDDTAYDAEIVDDSESRNVESGRCHVRWNVRYLRMDDGSHSLPVALFYVGDRVFDELFEHWLIEVSKLFEIQTGLADLVLAKPGEQ